MNQKSVLLIAIFLLVGGAIFFLPNDEKKIQNNLESLAEYCSSAPNEPLIETLQKVRSAAKLCTIPTRVEIESRSFSGDLSQKEITDRILMLKKRLPNTIFSFQDISIDIMNKGSANVIATLKLSGESLDGKFTDAYEVEITVDKIDNEWLFSSFTVVEFMKK